MIHSFNTTLAERYGIEEAILIEHLYWWIHKNDCDEVEEMFQEGRVWCRFTAKGISKYIPYMNAHKIWRVLQGLEKKDKIKVGNFNKLATNHTSWYAFSDDFILELEQLNYDFSKIKNRILKNEKSNNIIINNSIKENNIIEDKKRLSNDNQKKNYSDDFLAFWNLYHNGSKQQAYKEWNKLKLKEQQNAIDCVNTYLNYCKYSGRKQKDTSSYLHQKGFNEDWLATPDCYIVKDTDNVHTAKFKDYMVINHQELIYHRNPLTVEQIDEFFENCPPKQVVWAMNKLKKRDIHQYFSIAKGIEAIMNEDIEFDEDGEEQ